MFDKESHVLNKNNTANCKKVKNFMDPKFDYSQIFFEATFVVTLFFVLLTYLQPHNSNSGMAFKQLRTQGLISIPGYEVGHSSIGKLRRGS